MKTLFTLICFFLVTTLVSAQTLIPNAGFEAWTSYGSYSNPDSWDTPNQELMAIPFFGTTVVSKSTDKHGGSYSAKLESKHITLPPLDVPGFIITANLTLNINTMTYAVSGGVPINDQPTHLMGFFKYLPKGGDSTVVGIGLYRTTAGIRDTIAHGEFTTKDTVSDWTPFSAWIDYDTIVNPDTMQVYAFSTAQQTLTPGTVLYIDDVFLDYTTGFNEKDPGTGIKVYNDRGEKRLMVFFDFPDLRQVSTHLFDMKGSEVIATTAETLQKSRQIFPYEDFKSGIYILEILNGDRKFTKKYFLNN